jgi:hypothetical protein
LPSTTEESSISVENKRTAFLERKRKKAEVAGCPARNGIENASGELVIRAAAFEALCHLKRRQSPHR